MPNQPKTPTHTVRVENDLWDAAVAAAAANGTTVSEVVRKRLVAYVRHHTKADR